MKTPPPRPERPMPRAPVLGQVYLDPRNQERFVWTGDEWAPLTFAAVETVGRREPGVSPVVSEILGALVLALVLGATIGILAFCVWLVVT